VAATATTIPPGHTSIGCAPCTRPTHPGEDERAGRWWWEAATGRPAMPEDHRNRNEQINEAPELASSRAAVVGGA